MRLHAILPALLFAAASSVSFGAFAAADPDKAPPVDAKADQSAARMVKPQSTLDEKTDVTKPMAAGATSTDDSAKLVAGQDKSRHYHPRDGK